MTVCEFITGVYIHIGQLAVDRLIINQFRIADAFFPDLTVISVPDVRSFNAEAAVLAGCENEAALPEGDLCGRCCGRAACLASAGRGGHCRDRVCALQTGAGCGINRLNAGISAQPGCRACGHCICHRDRAHDGRCDRCHSSLHIRFHHNTPS